VVTVNTRDIGGIELPRIGRTMAKTLAASAAMGVAAHYSYAWLARTLPGDALMAQIIQVFGSIGVALAVLALAAHLLRLEEFGAAMARVLGRLRRP
jgi:hypothetical protein